MSTRWKAIELAVARVFGGKRAGAVGRMGPDILECPPYAIQVKHGAAANVPKWLDEAVRQTEGDAAEDELPLLVLHPRGWVLLDSLVVIRLWRFRDWFIGERRE